MAVASLASRVTGFLRSILLVAALGTGAVGDAYNLGNNLPNMVYELLLGGVLSSVLDPAARPRPGATTTTTASPTPSGCCRSPRRRWASMTLLAVLAAPLIAARLRRTPARSAS